MIVGSPTKLNLIPSGVMPVVYINQGDAGYDKEFLIYNGGSPYNVPSGVTATIRGTKADGFGVTEAAEVTEGSNLVTVTITEQMVAAEGANLYELVFVDTDGLRIATINMVWAVKADALGDAVISESDLDYATTVMNQLQSVQAFKNQLDTNIEGLAAETVARIAADATLQSNINTEASTRATQDSVLQSQIDQYVTPSTQQPDEVVNARVGADGTTYSTLGDAIRGQVTDLKDALTNAVVERNPSWRKGVYVSDGYGATSSNTWRCSSKLPAGKYTISSSSVKFECYKYVSDTSGTLLVDQRTDEITFISDGEFIVSFRKNDSSSLAGMTDAELNALINIQNHTVVYELNKRIDSSDDSINYIGECGNHLDLSLFTIGSLANGILNTAITYRIATLNILEFDFDLTVICKESYRFGIQTFIGETYNSDSGWKRYYTIPRGTRFKLVIRKEPEDTSSVANIAEFAEGVYLLSNIARKATSEVYPYAYTGERIQIAQNRCHAYPVFSLTRPESKPNFSLQGAAAYGNTLVRTGLNGDVAIYDIENASGNVIPVAALTINTPDSHGNCANFSNIFYEVDDALPLLYVTSSANNSPIAECTVVRIIENDGAYSATTIQTITIDYTNFGANGYEEYNIYPMWLVDDYLWCYGAKYKTSSAPQETDPINKIIITKFAIPSISNSSVTLNADDVLDQFTCEYKSTHVLQGACIYNKKIYAPEGVPNRGYLNVYDVLHRVRTNEIDFAANGYPITQEPEDTFICDDELYLATGSPSTFKFEF